MIIEAKCYSGWNSIMRVSLKVNIELKRLYVNTSKYFDLFTFIHLYVHHGVSLHTKKSYNFDYKSNKNFLIYIFIFWKRIIRFSRFEHLSIPIAEGFEGERKTDNYSTWCIYYAGMKNAISTLGAINIV